MLKYNTDFYANKIAEAGGDQKQLYRLTSVLMGNKREIILPSHKSEKQLSDTFCDFFNGKIKIKKIRYNLSATVDGDNCDVF